MRTRRFGQKCQAWTSELLPWQLHATSEVGARCGTLCTVWHTWGLKDRGGEERVLLGEERSWILAEHEVEMALSGFRGLPSLVHEGFGWRSGTRLQH